MDRRCSVDGCSRPYRARGLCPTHLWRLYRHGDPNAIVRDVSRAVSALCRISGCTHTRKSGGKVCSMHLERMRRTGTFDRNPVFRDGCSVVGCGRKHDAKGFCSLHYRRANPGKVLEWNHSRRARKIGTMAEPIPAWWLEVLRRDPCSYCGGNGGEIDHVVPLKNGGTHTIGNLVGACRPCNARKRIRSALAFIRRSA